MMHTDQHISIRHAALQDVDAIFQWENNEDHWFVSNTQIPFTREQIVQFIQFENDIYGANQTRFMIFDANDSPVGCIDLFEYDPVNMRVGVGVLIDPKFRGKGYGKAAISLVMEYCVEELRVHQLYAEVLEDNKASQVIFEDMGFVQSGLKKQWMWDGEKFVDQIFYQRLLS
jgi:diamine N-acetyltransferase